MGMMMSDQSMRWIDSRNGSGSLPVRITYLYHLCSLDGRASISPYAETRLESEDQPLALLTRRVLGDSFSSRLLGTT